MKVLTGKEIRDDRNNLIGICDVDSIEFVQKLDYDAKTSRLDDEYILAVVRNRSGMDAGEIDFSIKIDRFYDLSFADLERCELMLKNLQNRCRDRAEELREDQRTARPHDSATT